MCVYSRLGGLEMAREGREKGRTSYFFNHSIFHHSLIARALDCPRRVLYLIYFIYFICLNSMLCYRKGGKAGMKELKGFLPLVHHSMDEGEGQEEDYGR